MIADKLWGHVFVAEEDPHEMNMIHLDSKAQCQIQLHQFECTDMQFLQVYIREPQLLQYKKENFTGQA